MQYIVQGRAEQAEPEDRRRNWLHRDGTAPLQVGRGRGQQLWPHSGDTNTNEAGGASIKPTSPHTRRSATQTRKRRKFSRIAKFQPRLHAKPSHTHTPSGQIDRLPSPPFYKFAIIIANFILTLNAQYNHKRLRARGATANTAHLHNCDATLASVCVLVPPLRVLPSNSRNLLSTKEKKKTNTLFKVEKNRHFFHSPQTTLHRKRCHSHSIAPFTPKAGFARTHFQIREIIKHTRFSVGRREYRSLGHLHSVLNCAWFAAVVVPPNTCDGTTLTAYCCRTHGRGESESGGTNTVMQSSSLCE